MYTVLVIYRVKCYRKLIVRDSSRGGHQAFQRYRYISALPLTSALDEMGGQRHALAALSPRKTRYPLYRRLDGP
jgi:hypothetical protein